MRLPAAWPPRGVAVASGSHLASIKNRNKLIFMAQCIKSLASAGSLNLDCSVNLIGCYERGHDLKPQVVFLLGRVDN